MVCLRLAGGCLSAADKGDIQARLDAAAQLYAQGEIGAAAARYHDILGVSKNNPDALHMLGVIAQRANKPDLALTLFEEALAARPLFPQVRFNRAVLLRLMGRDTEAMMSARMAVDNDPELAPAWDLIGQIYRDKGNIAEATDCFIRAIKLQNNNPHFYGNYGLLLYSQGNLNAAYQAARQAERLDENYPPMLLGNILHALGYPELAAEKFARARALRPKFKDGSASEAMSRLQTGDLEQGWALWEQRADLIPDHEAALKKLPLWDGEKIDHLILYEDQGLGDAIQFMRFLPSVKTRANQITLRLRKPLLNLAMDNFFYVSVSADDTILPDTDARCRLSSLPFFFKTKFATIPPAPYLAASVQRRSEWREKMRPHKQPRIGLVWAGNANFRHDGKRSIPIEKLTPLLDCGVEHFISLQKESPNTPGDVFDPTPDLHDFADTAALICELDLVITVDTAIAHLAGAMGKPVFVLLPFISDWRWLLGRTDSPWYKTARLFRQNKPDDWDTVIQKVVTEVKKLIGGDRDVLKPALYREENLRQHPDALPLPP